jgi:hypothetical protein
MSKEKTPHSSHASSNAATKLQKSRGPSVVIDDEDVENEEEKVVSMALHAEETVHTYLACKGP